jgi:integrase/recombinase XerD
MSQTDAMKADLARAGYSKRTQQLYAEAAVRFLRRFPGPVERLGIEQVREYVAELETRGVSASTRKVEMAGIRFFFATTLGRPEVVAWMRWPRQKPMLPVVLAGTEVEALLGAVSSPLYRAVITTMYAAGLRISEACALQLEDIDSKRGVIRVRCGKGGQSRYVMLGERLLLLLRGYWAANRPPAPFLFPGPDGRQPVDPRSVREAVAAAVQRAGLKKRVTPHLLRHSFATHLVELGTDIRVIQHLLGHASIRSTQHYTQVARPTVARARTPHDVLGTDEAKVLG